MILSSLALAAVLNTAPVIDKAMSVESAPVISTVEVVQVEQKSSTSTNRRVPNPEGLDI